VNWAQKSAVSGCRQGARARAKRLVTPGIAAPCRRIAAKSINAARDNAPSPGKQDDVGEAPGPEADDDPDGPSRVSEGSARGEPEDADRPVDAVTIHRVAARESRMLGLRNVEIL
jgi:hypothetical protein